MAKDSNSDFPDAAYFQNLATQISSHPAWVYPDNPGPSLGQAAERAAVHVTTTGMAELDFAHASAGGTLYLMMPNQESTAAVTGRLRQALVPDPASSLVDGFYADLAEAYEKIAANHTSRYVEPIRTESDIDLDISCLRVPWEYDGDNLADGLDALHQASKEAEELNSAIRDDVKSYVNM